MIKIRVSYERPEELQQLLECMGRNVKSIKKPRMQEGKFRKAYIELKSNCDNARSML